MTTSLANQLQSLRTATSIHLTVEKRHVSLLFDKKDAGKLNNETAHRIGVAGLEQMKRIDPVFDTELPNELFGEDRVDFVRSLLDKEANEKLDQKIEKLLFELSPYLQHFACQQVLEYLVHTYQIYAYNAETLIVTFLPFHETKVYARILNILDFDWSRSKEFEFMQQFRKSEKPIPFSSIVKATMSGTHSIITRLSDHINKGIEVVGSEYLESKAATLFNFHAKLLLNLFNDPLKVDETLLSKLMPLVENGVKSSMASFRYSAFMIICQLVLTVKLKKDVIQSLCKLLITKMRVDTAASAISTLVVICQQQDVEGFSRKTIQKLLRNEAELGVWKTLADLSLRTDLTKFYNVLWKELFGLVSSEDENEQDVEIAFSGLFETTNSLRLASQQATLFLRMLFTEASNGHYVDEKKKLKANVHSIVTRFAAEFDTCLGEWKRKDEKLTGEFIEKYELEKLIVVNTEFLEERKSASQKVAVKENAENGGAAKEKKPTASEKAAALAEASEFAKRKTFSGDPLNKAREWIKKKEWENVTWALNEMAKRPAYLSGKPADDVEELVVEVIQAGIEKKEGLDVSSIRNALANANITPSFIGDLLTRQDSVEKAAKRTKGPRGMEAVNIVKKAFSDESLDEYNTRIVFVLEMLKVRDVVRSDSRVLASLFDVIKQVNANSEADQMFYHQQLAVSVLIGILETPGKTKISSVDLDMDCIVETMRATHSHHLLRDCLRLLTAAVKHAPETVVKHIMSVFTFMGNGLMRKDNEMTLSIVEKTVQSLFSAIIETGSVAGAKTTPNSENTVNSNKKLSDSAREKLIQVSKLFAASATDVPAHRRARIAHAIARAVGAENAATVTLVLMAGFCVRWQRATDEAAQEAAKRGSEQDAYDDLAMEMLAALDPFEQLSSVLDIIDFVLRLGGDQNMKNGKESGKPSLQTLIFDRSANTLPRLRHYRYVLVSFIARVFANRSLIERLAAYDDEELLKRALPQGRRLMECSVELDEFASRESELANQAQSDAQTQRYWVAFASRAEVVSEKLRHLLPGGVAARLIADVLGNAPYKMCEKALQLANIKLGHDGYFFTDSGINEKELIALAQALNTFISPELKSEDKIRLCQNSAYTLKLIAKHLPLQSESTVLADTMQRCVNTVSQYQKLDDNLTGNVLLLAGELIRSHNMKSTMQHSVPLLGVCLSILQECITKQVSAQKSSMAEAAMLSEARNRGQRIRQQSLGGLRLGSDTLLICALTCIQRIFDQYASFVCESVGEVVVSYCRLVGRFGDVAENQQQTASTMAVPYASGSQTSGLANKTSVQHRLSLIRRSLLTVELRVLPAHFAKAVETLKNEQKSLRALFNLLGGYFETKNRATVSQLRIKLIDDIFLPALEFRSRQRKPELFENTEKLELTIFDAFIGMASILNEHECRPIVTRLVTWAEPGMLPTASLAAKLRLVALFNFANSFYSAFNSLALPYFGRILELAAKVMKSCNVTLIGETSEVLLTGKRGTIEALEANMLLTSAIDLIANAARHKEFFTPDRCELVADVLVDELVNTKAEGHEERCTGHLVLALYRIGDADSDNFPELLNKIMIKTRDNRAKIRYRTLLVLEQLLEKIGEGIQPHLTILLPFLNELIEDENKQVEDQCQQVISVLQHKFGENFWQGSSA